MDVDFLDSQSQLGRIEEGFALENETAPIDDTQDEPMEESRVAEVDDASKGRSKAKAPSTSTRDPGKSLFPVARVQRVLKADKELPTVAREAVFLISLATEEFVKRLAEASHNTASREKRVTVQRKDVASVVRRADEFLFLEEIIPWTGSSDVPARRKPGQKHAQRQDAGTFSLDKFMKDDDPREEDEESVPDAEIGHGEVQMNEDGTMQMA